MEKKAVRSKLYNVLPYFRYDYVLTYISVYIYITYILHINSVVNIFKYKHYCNNPLKLYMSNLKTLWLDLFVPSQNVYNGSTDGNRLSWSCWAARTSVKKISNNNPFLLSLIEKRFIQEFTVRNSVGWREIYNLNVNVSLIFHTYLLILNSMFHKLPLRDGIF